MDFYTKYYYLNSFLLVLINHYSEFGFKSVNIDLWSGIWSLLEKRLNLLRQITQESSPWRQKGILHILLLTSIPLLSLVARFFYKLLEKVNGLAANEELADWFCARRWKSNRKNGNGDWYIVDELRSTFFR